MAVRAGRGRGGEVGGEGGRRGDPTNAEFVQLGAAVVED